ncbi:MAG: PhzF family phenazine biosynthesis protein [Variibacter sp.]
MPMRRRFATLDVFTRHRFAGNPLAVVQDAQGLSDDAMQAIAREFNLSETVFVFPPADKAHRAKLRIFTPAAELPFAGHPTVGTAVLLAEGRGPESFVLEENIGPVRCDAERHGDEVGRARFALPRLPKHMGDLGEASDVAAALSLTLDDLGCDDFEPGLWSAGVGFAMVPIRGLDAAERARPDITRWEDAFGAKPTTGAFVFCRETAQPGHAFHARMFAPLMGITEDPATGAAIAAFAGLVARTVMQTAGEQTIVIEQGFEMKRPSLITLSLTLADGALARASIGGDAVLVSEGTIEA